MVFERQVEWRSTFSDVAALWGRWNWLWKVSCVYLGLCGEIVKPQGEKSWGSGATLAPWSSVWEPGEHKIRDRCEVHYILTSLRSWLQSRWTYWGFLPPSSSSPDIFSENIKVCWVINWNVNRKLQLARLSRCETQCYESYSIVTKRAQRPLWRSLILQRFGLPRSLRKGLYSLGISCCGLTTVWCKRSCFLDKMRIPQ